MRYISTRGSGEVTSSAGAIKQGIAKDGGLFVPEELPILTEGLLSELCTLSYPERAAKILYLYLNDDYTEEELLCDCKDAYSEERFPGGAAPVVRIGDRTEVLELWHGPTCAFKDMALQLMPKLLSRALVKTGEKRTAYILVATSGDTGKAALEGYRDVEKVKISVFYPVSGVSAIQKLQMATQEGSNVSVHSVVGNFDDAQNGVKAIFADKEAIGAVNEKDCFFSSANSINWGRLAPQIAYYISAYCDLVNKGAIPFGEEINVTVPTGNFGNILAAYLAKKMGLPINHLICASNQNSVLTDFFKTGIYDRNRPFYTTVSPSMDILISSNLERLLFYTAGAEATGKLMAELKKNGRYEISPELLRRLNAVFTGLCCPDDREIRRSIRRTFDLCSGYLADTHTGVALFCAEKYQLMVDRQRTMLIVSTASPYKFSPAVLASLTDEVPADEFESMRRLSALTGTEIPEKLIGVLKKEVRFDPAKPIKADEMKETVIAEA